MEQTEAGSAPQRVGGGQELDVSFVWRWIVQPLGMLMTLCLVVAAIDAGDSGPGGLGVGGGLFLVVGLCTGFGTLVNFIEHVLMSDKVMPAPLTPRPPPVPEHPSQDSG